MPQYPLRLPEDLYQRSQHLADQQGVSLNQFFLYAVANMAAEIETRSFFRQRSSLASEEATAIGLSVLDKVPKVAPVAGDELPEHAKPKRAPSRKPTRAKG
ncbi:MAG: hypothetical protein AMXMBFR33_29970 [Candidatus Xenobia bacterium]